jgi:hypothetical protein
MIAAGGSFFGGRVIGSFSPSLIHPDKIAEVIIMINATIASFFTDILPYLIYNYI